MKVERPVPGPGELVLRNRAVAVNFHGVHDLFRQEALDLPTETLDLADAAEAHARLEGQETVRKLLLQP